MYDVHLRLIGKRVVDFLFVLIKFFLLHATTEALRVNIEGKSAISFQQLDQKISGKRVAPNNHSSSQKTRLTDLSYSIKIWTNLCSHFVTIQTFVRRTDTYSFLVTRPPCTQCGALKSIFLRFYLSLSAVVWCL